MGANPIRIMAGLSALSALTAAAQSAPPAPSGETHAIVRRYVTASTSSDGSTGSSQGSDTFIERLVARRDGGIEREFDLPPDAKSRQWQFPARVFAVPGQPMRLLNVAAMEQRRDRWLAAAKLTPAACGSWIFTWNVFRIECDPDSVIGTIEAIDLAAQPLAEGVAYSTDTAAAPLRLKRDGATYLATGPVDPDKVRRARAETDVIVARISGKPIPLEDALRAHANDPVSGIVSVRFEPDPQGIARKRTTTTVIETRHSDGRIDRETATRIVERRPLPASRS